MAAFDPILYLDRVIAGAPDLPPFLEILPVNPCNHRCVFCISADYRMDRDRLPREAMLGVIAEAGAGGYGFIRFCGGGEPLLHPDAAEMLATCARHGVTADLTTNGSLLRGELLQAAMGSCELIRISFNGGNPQAYAASHRVHEKEYHRVLANLAAIRHHPLKKNTRIELSFVVCRENENSIPDFLELAAGMEVDLAVIITDTDADPQKADHQEAVARTAIDAFGPVPEMEVRLRRSRPDSFIRTDLPCVQALMYGVVAANGDYYASCHHVGMEEFRLGNVLASGSVAAILSDPEVHRRRMEYAFGTGKKLEKFVHSAHNLDYLRSYNRFLAVKDNA